MEIKDIEIKDRQKVIKLLNFYLIESNQKNLSYQFKKNAAKFYVDIYFKLQQTNKVYFKGLYINDKLLSVLMCRVERNPFLVKEYFLFIEFAITKNSERNKGYMKNLVEDMNKFAKKKDIADIQLRVFFHNIDGFNFWKKMGFHEFSISMSKKINL